MLVALMFKYFRNCWFFRCRIVKNVQPQIMHKILTKARANDSASCVTSCAAGSYKKADGTSVYNKLVIFCKVCDWL